MLSIFYLICIIARGMFFHKSKDKWYKTFIPVYNIYTLGKLNNQKKLGLATGIVLTFTNLFFVFCFAYELWILENYTTNIQIPQALQQQGIINVAVPENVANVAIYSKYILLAVATLSIMLWSILLWKFLIYQKSNYWWIILWVMIPVIPYVYFGVIRKKIVIDNKMYVFEKQIREVKAK